MTKHDIDERLASVSLRPSAEGMERALAAARGVVLSRSRRAGATVRIAGFVLLLISLVGLTPPGRSLAEAVGNLVGIGDDPTKPSVLFEEAENQSVIGLGEAPNGNRYELVRASEADGPGRQRTTCYYVSFPDLNPDPMSSSCLTRAALRGLRSDPLQVFVNASPDELGADGALTITGSVADRVATVEVQQGSAGGSPVVMQPPLAPLVARPSFPPRKRLAHPHRLNPPDARTEVKAFVAFLPFDPPNLKQVRSGDLVEQHKAEMANAERYAQALESIEITARDGNGKVVSAIRLGEIPNIGYSLELGRDPAGP